MMISHLARRDSISTSRGVLAYQRNSQLGTWPLHVHPGGTRACWTPEPALLLPLSLSLSLKLRGKREVSVGFGFCVLHLNRPLGVVGTTKGR